MRRAFWGLLCLFLLCLPSAPAGAETFELTCSGGTVNIQTTLLDGEDWLFLPSFANPDQLGKNLLPCDREENCWLLGGEKPVHVMRSENLRTLFLFSDDPVNQGRGYIENCDRHENAATASMALVSADGTVDHAGRIVKLRGRGNGTWTADKRAYQIKLEDRMNLLDTGNPDSLPAVQAENQYGLPYTFVEGLADNANPGAGAYFLEMESAATLSDRCWFSLSNGSRLAVKNPENASDSMMRYISEKLETLYRAVKSGSPDAEKLLDIDAFARAALIHELAYNLDGYQYSSSFFVLPAGSERFEPAAVWDFDQAWRYQLNGVNAGGRGWKDQGGWLWNFYGMPSFFKAMQQIVSQELYPLIQNVLLGTQDGRCLKSLNTYAAHTAASRRMNERLHGVHFHPRMIGGASAEEELALLERFIRERVDWLYNVVMNGDACADNLILRLDVGYTGLEFGDIRLQVCPWSHVQLADHSLHQLSEATEDSYALWQLDMEFAAEPGYAFEQPAVVMNDAEVSCLLQENGRLLVSVVFEDLSYRPVDGFGQDIGLVYNHDEYALHHPEVARLCENDPEAMIEYFLYDGMYEGHQANAFFNPRQILASRPLMEEMYGEDWSLYYFDFISYGVYDGWLDGLNPRFIPSVSDAPSFP